MTNDLMAPYLGAIANCKLINQYLEPVLAIWEAEVWTNGRLYVMSGPLGALIACSTLAPLSHTLAEFLSFSPPETEEPPGPERVPVVDMGQVHHGIPGYAVAGVYHVKLHGKTMYIGQSKSIADRLKGHYPKVRLVLSDPGSSVEWIHVPDPAERNFVEALWIGMYRPPLNFGERF